MSKNSKLTLLLIAIAIALPAQAMSKDISQPAKTNEKTANAIAMPALAIALPGLTIAHSAKDVEQPVKAIAMAALTITQPASVVTESYGSLLSGNFQPAESFATLAITGSGSIYNFTLKALDLNSIFTNGAFIGSIVVNVSSNSMPTISNVWGDAPVSISSGGGPTGQFDFRFDLTGLKKARLTANESVSWTATFSNPVTFDGEQFALHVQGLTQAQGGSAFYVNTVSPVPEPETYAMLLAGLGLIGFMAKRKKS